MQCPRCDAENSDTRAACWKCFAQLHPPEGTKPQAGEIKKGKLAPVTKSEPEAATIPIAEPELEPAELPVEEAEPSDTPIISSDETPTPPVEEKEEIPQPMSTEKVFDLDEHIPESGYVVPGLAEPAPEVEEETSTEIDQPAVVEETDAETEEEPGMDWEDLPIFDPDAVDEAAPAVAPAPTTESSPIKEKRKDRAADKEDSAPAKPKPRRGANFLLLIIIGVLVIGLLAAWWFILWNPSPVPVAKEYIGAMNAAMAGDSQNLASICTAESQASIDSAVRALGQMKMSGFAVQMTAGEIESVAVTGNTAQVRLNVNTSVSNMQMQVSKPMPIALVREGSAIRRQWKVDMAATSRLAAEDAKAMLQKVFPGGIPNMPGGVSGRFSAPR